MLAVEDMYRCLINCATMYTRAKKFVQKKVAGRKKCLATGRAWEQTSTAINLSLIQVALARGADPAGQTVGNVAGVAVSGNAVLEVSARGNRATVVNASSLVEAGDVAVASVPVGSLVDAVGETVAGAGTGSAVGDHLGDGRLGARVGNDAVVVAGSGPVMVLHQPRVSDAVVGGGDADAATGLLQDDGKDESVVDTGLLGHLLDGVPDVTDLLAGVLGLAEPGAGAEHGDLVVVEHVVEGNPLALSRPTRRDLAVAQVQGVLVDTIADAILDVGVVPVGQVGHGDPLAGITSGDVGGIPLGLEVTSLVAERGGLSRSRAGNGSSGQKRSKKECRSHCI